jgi:hypothetical protein
MQSFNFAQEPETLEIQVGRRVETKKDGRRGWCRYLDHSKVCLFSIIYKELNFKVENLIFFQNVEQFRKRDLRISCVGSSRMERYTNRNE